MSTSSFINTQNQHGVMHSLNPIAQCFVQHAESCEGPFLDIGAAYGVATLPVLQLQKNVTAIDINEEHLLKIKEDALFFFNTSELRDSKLQCLQGKFPYITLATNHFDGILISHVLPFLNGDEIEAGLQKCYEMLKPGGRLFILSYTIFNKLMRNYIPTYLERKIAGDPWPGFLEDASAYWDTENQLSKLLPKQLNHCDPELLTRAFKKTAFEIEFLDYLNIQSHIPADVWYQGKETVGVIAVKNS